MILSKVAAATVELEEAFQKVLPHNPKKMPREADWAAAIKQFHGAAREIRQRHRLGPLARARVAYRLQHRLIAAGYPADAVRQLVFSLVLNVFVGKV